MIFACALFVAAALTGQQPDVPPFLKDPDTNPSKYYQSPDPTRSPKILKEFLKKENVEHAWFAKNETVPLLIAAMIGDMAVGKPEIVHEYEAAFADAPPLGRKVIIRALTNAGDQETLAKVTTWLADKGTEANRAELEALKKHLEDPKRKSVRDKPAQVPLDLDFLWGNFFITGEYAPISRILDVFDLPDAKENETMKRVAKWSLGSNLQQHPKLVELVQKNKKDRPEASRKVIDQLIITPGK